MLPVVVRRRTRAVAPASTPAPGATVALEIELPGGVVRFYRTPDLEVLQSLLATLAAR